MATRTVDQDTQGHLQRRLQEAARESVSSVRPIGLGRNISLLLKKLKVSRISSGQSAVAARSKEGR